MLMFVVYCMFNVVCVVCVGWICWLVFWNVCCFLLCRSMYCVLCWLVLWLWFSLCIWNVCLVVVVVGVWWCWVFLFFVCGFCCLWWFSDGWLVVLWFVWYCGLLVCMWMCIDGDWGWIVLVSSWFLLKWWIDIDLWCVCFR